jgi:hypothetical protein
VGTTAPAPKRFDVREILLVLALCIAAAVLFAAKLVLKKSPRQHRRAAR